MATLKSPAVAPGQWPAINLSLNTTEDFVKIILAIMKRRNDLPPINRPALAFIGDWFVRLTAYFRMSMIVRTGNTIMIKKEAKALLKAKGIEVSTHFIGATFIDFKKDDCVVRFFFDGGEVKIAE